MPIGSQHRPARVSARRPRLIACGFLAARRRERRIACLVRAGRWIARGDTAAAWAATRAAARAVAWAAAKSGR